MKKLFTSVMSIFILTVLHAQPTTSEMDKAETYFRNSSFLTFNEDYSPKDYIGSLIYYKPGEKANLRVLKITKPNDSTTIRTDIDDILYQKMHTRDEVVNAKFLGIFNSKVTNQHLLEVILLRDYSLEAESYFTNLDLYAKILRISKSLTNAGYNVEFVWKVNVNKLTSRIFKEGSAEVGFNYKAEGSGKTYNKTEDFTKKNLITLQTMDVDIFFSEANKSIEKVILGNGIVKSSLEKSIIETHKPKDYILVDKIIFDGLEK